MLNYVSKMTKVKVSIKCTDDEGNEHKLVIAGNCELTDAGIMEAARLHGAKGTVVIANKSKSGQLGGNSAAEAVKEVADTYNATKKVA